VNAVTLRRTWIGAAVGAAVFGGVSLVTAVRSGAPFPDVLQPIGVLAVIGLTVGALAGPLVGGALARRKEHHPD
jgi:hypothetical protein